MEFYGTITNVIGYPDRPTFIICVRGLERERRVRILDVHEIRPLDNGYVDMYLNGNILTDNESGEIECLVIVEVHNMEWANELCPKNYMNKQVYVHSLR